MVVESPLIHLLKLQKILGRMSKEANDNTLAAVRFNTD
jgi:hypothetical protein